VRRPVAKLTGLVVTTWLLLTACAGPSPTIVAGSPRPVDVTASTPTAIVSAAPADAPTIAATPTAAPPRNGTLAWYLSRLPRFNPPPAPPKIHILPASGPALQVYQVPVGGQRVAFITIDDGWLKDPDIVIMLRVAHIPFTMFLTTNAISSDPSFFKTLQGLGGVIEDHTVTHPQLSQDSYDQQRREICDNRATLARLYGRAPIIMRAPYSMANTDTLRAAASCGIRANVSWNEYAITGSITWQRPGGIRLGDMVLMHFDTYLKANLLATLQEFHRDRITPALLENYLVT
jgi:peptidoglycan/xylan/chitin deacetylase (PgdA/CDA1 family)